jgi:DNA (cytosine-5)-methyltransferase 1
MNYYNEWDSFAAAWLKELIKDGLIPDGEVDSRSIADVEPSDLKGFTQCHFFAGIGGWSRALQLAGWSSDRPVWTGSPPCQSFSTAGKGKGKDDERHLWPVFFNLIRECQPPTVFGEQVAAAIRFGWLDDLQIDFEKEGYAAGAFVLPSGSIGAPHKRDRLFFVADSHSERLQRRQEARQQCSKFECDNGSEIRPFARSSAAVSTVADPHNERHERSSGDGRQEKRGSEHAGSCSLADTTSGRHKQSEQFSNGCPSQSDKRQSDSSGNCESQRQLMADSCGERCGGKEWGGEAEEKGQSERYSTERSSHSSVGDTNSDRSQQGNEAAETAGHRDTADSAGIRAETVGNPEHDGSHGAEIGRSSFEASNSGKEGQDVSCESEGAGRSEIAGDICFWQDSTVIYCRDGKYRPIPTEPALFPLADGIPNRVGILRGAGNAIVPQAAAEIIKAYLYD